jgi:hypothetical protein
MLERYASPPPAGSNDVPDRHMDGGGWAGWSALWHAGSSMAIASVANVVSKK